MTLHEDRDEEDLAGKLSRATGHLALAKNVLRRLLKLKPTHPVDVDFLSALEQAHIEQAVRHQEDLKTLTERPARVPLYVHCHACPGIMRLDLSETAWTCEKCHAKLKNKPGTTIQPVNLLG